jgi:hypothetical protein
VVKRGSAPPSRAAFTHWWFEFYIFKVEKHVKQALFFNTLSLQRTEKKKDFKKRSCKY